MASTTQERRAALSARLLDIAEARIAEGGPHAIRARDLAREANCAVGAIYNINDDLENLVMEVNGRTFRRLGAHVTGAVAESRASDPVEQLVVMGEAYLDFAASNPNAWRSLFDLEMSTEAEVPNWYLEELDSLFQLIAGPLRALDPDMTPEAAMLLTRALFSSVHGIVYLGLEKRLSAVPRDEMARMVELVVRAVASRRNVT